MQPGVKKKRNGQRWFTVRGQAWVDASPFLSRSLFLPPSLSWALFLPSNAVWIPCFQQWDWCTVSSRRLQLWLQALSALSPLACSSLQSRSLSHSLFCCVLHLSPPWHPSDSPIPSCFFSLLHSFCKWGRCFHITSVSSLLFYFICLFYCLLCFCAKDNERDNLLCKRWWYLVCHTWLTLVDPDLSRNIITIFFYH